MEVIGYLILIGIYAAIVTGVLYGAYAVAGAWGIVFLCVAVLAIAGLRG